MGTTHTLTLTLDVAELLAEFMPKLARGYLAASGAAEGLAGTEFTLTVDVSGCEYGYVVRDGKEFQVREGGLESPMVRVSIPLEDLERMVRLRHIDFLGGMQHALSRQKYDVISRLKGTTVFNLTHPEGGATAITVVFNGAEAPRAAFTLTMEHAQELVSREDNPVQMFMAGKLRIEGDMAFAMSIQPLFT